MKSKTSRSELTKTVVYTAETVEKVAKMQIRAATDGIVVILTFGRFLVLIGSVFAWIDNGEFNRVDVTALESWD